MAAMRRAIAKGVDRDEAIITAARARPTYQDIRMNSAFRVEQIVAPILGYRMP
jgi:hypothetical protein